MKKYLLDTHSFLWAILQPANLGNEARIVLEKPENHIYVSCISFWEISLKYSLGKLELDCTPDYLMKFSNAMNFKEINLTVMDTALFYQLPKTLHKDPFDRMLIWQAIAHDFILISKDSKFENYSQFGLKTVW